MIPAYQVWSQPFYGFVDLNVQRSKSFPAALGGNKPWLFRLWFRTLYTVLTTFFACLLPFFGIILGLIGALGFWPATVFFPIECWIKVFKPGPKMKQSLRVRAWNRISTTKESRNEIIACSTLSANATIKFQALLSGHAHTHTGCKGDATCYWQPDLAISTVISTEPDAC